MEIKSNLFNIPFPFRLFKHKKIDFLNKNQRKMLFKRNIYFYLYNKKKNELLNKRWRIFYDLALKIKKFLIKKNEIKASNILSISIFGSALYSLNNDDFDFLVIIKGNIFDYIKTKIKINKNESKVGISLKGEENLSKGNIDKNSRFDTELQTKIIHRTSVSLPYRHLPILGLDFKENRDIFILNCPALIFDLLINTYHNYYLKKEIPNPVRARKILCRVFEASKYASLLLLTKRLEKLQKVIYKKLNEKNNNLKESKKIFKEFVNYYNKKFCS